ncbi:hypothetical protein, partial [Helicobacter heilmannii]|uniref:hypothetical protein n=1 Tax=Helicobacter heilmannii TaxID=35817 RepID=UPI0006B37A96
EIGGGGAIVALLLAGCTTKIAEIKPNQVVTGNTHSVYWSACQSFTWPYGPVDDLKQEVMQHLQEQMNAYAQGERAGRTAQSIEAHGRYVGEAKVKEWELVNTKFTKTIYPYFWGLLGMKCVEARGFARPKAD